MIIFVLSVIILILSLVIMWLLIRYQGTIIVIQNEGKKSFFLELDKHPEEIENMKAVRFRVVKGKSQNKQ